MQQSQNELRKWFRTRVLPAEADSGREIDVLDAGLKASSTRALPTGNSAGQLPVAFCYRHFE